LPHKAPEQETKKTRQTEQYSCAVSVGENLYDSSKNTVYDLIDVFLPHEKNDGFPLKSPQ
jgi:hypothetical protein